MHLITGLTTYAQKMVDKKFTPYYNVSRVIRLIMVINASGSYLREEISEFYMKEVRRYVRSNRGMW